MSTVPICVLQLRSLRLSASLSSFRAGDVYVQAGSLLLPGHETKMTRAVLQRTRSEWAKDAGSAS